LENWYLLKGVTMMSNLPPLKEVIISLGARNLAEQKYKTLPTFDMLIEEIKSIRKSAQNTMTANELTRNNTIGIFGSRGTGKTSTLMTLKAELAANDSELNWQTVIIEPDLYGDHTKLVGSIINCLKSLVKDFINEIERHVERFLGSEEAKKFYKQYYKNSMRVTGNPLQRALSSVIEYYLYSEKEYRDILVSYYTDPATYTKKSEHVLSPDIEFRKKFFEFIDVLVSEKKKYNTFVHNRVQCEEPLIFIYIDDIDLKAYKVKELMDTLMQLTNHKNLVFILTGDYDKLKDALWITLLRDGQLKEAGVGSDQRNETKDIFNTESLQIWNGYISDKNQLADEYIKKIIPPVRRYYVVNWEGNRKKDFTYNDVSNQSVSLQQQLRHLLGDSNPFMLILKKLSNNDQFESILYSFDDSYSLFDNKARGLNNVYISINQLNQYEIHNSDSQQLFNFKKQLIESIVNSNNELAAVQQNIFTKVIVFGDTAETTYIHLDMLRINDEKKSELNFSQDTAAKVFILCELLRLLLDKVNYDSNQYTRIKREYLSYIISNKSKGKINDLKNYWINQFMSLEDVFDHLNLSEALYLINYVFNKNDMFIEKYAIKNDIVRINWFIAFVELLIVNSEDKLVNIYQSRNWFTPSEQNVLNYLRSMISRVEEKNIVSLKYAKVSDAFNIFSRNFTWKKGSLDTYTLSLCHEILINTLTAILRGNAVQTDREINIQFIIKNINYNKVGDKAKLTPNQLIAIENIIFSNNSAIARLMVKVICDIDIQKTQEVNFDHHVKFIDYTKVKACFDTFMSEDSGQYSKLKGLQHESKHLFQADENDIELNEIFTLYSKLVQHYNEPRNHYGNRVAQQLALAIRENIFIPVPKEVIQAVHEVDKQIDFMEYDTSISGLYSKASRLVAEKLEQVDAISLKKLEEELAQVDLEIDEGEII